MSETTAFYKAIAKPAFEQSNGCVTAGENVLHPADVWTLRTLREAGQHRNGFPALAAIAPVGRAGAEYDWIDRQLQQERTAAMLLMRRIVNRFAAVLLFAQGPHDNGDMWRAGGDCVCPECGEEYWRHVVDPYDTFLHVLCSGDRVKI